MECIVCANSATQRCGGCARGPFCGADCQRADWDTHKQSCARLGRPFQQFRFVWRDNRSPIGSTLLTELSSPVDGESSMAQEERYHGATFRLKDIEAKTTLAVNPAEFVQLVASLSSGFPKARGIFSYGLSAWGGLHFVTGFHPECAVQLTNSAGKTETLRACCIESTNSHVSKAMDRFLYYDKQWLLGPDAKGRYLGMAPQGPTRMPLDYWTERQTKLLWEFSVPSAMKMNHYLMLQGALRKCREPWWTLRGAPQPSPRRDTDPTSFDV